MTTAIKIEGLSKKYIIGHQRQENYTALRDVMMHKFRSLGQRIRHPLSPNLEVVEQEELWALRNIDLEIGQGERIGIIGRNGAGKSTLLKVLSRITEPTTGRFSMNGRVASLLEVGTGFHPELTGRENIFLNGAILGMNKREIKRKFDEIVEFAETEKFLDTPVKRYSSGMYMRLAFSVAAHLDPEILIVDEVLAVGDVAFQKKCLGRMQQVGSEGRTVLFVSHNMAAIKTLCDRAVLLDQGCVACQGPVEQTIQSYVTTGENPNTCTSWPEPGKAPGNELLRLKKLRVVNALAGEENNEITVETPIRFEIEFWNLKPGLRHISLHLKGISGEIIFASPSPKHQFGTGLVGFSCEIPANYLNSGFFTFMVLVVNDGVPVFTYDMPTFIEVMDVKRVGNWLGEWPGVVRPVFGWEHKFSPDTPVESQ